MASARFAPMTWKLFEVVLEVFVLIFSKLDAITLNLPPLRRLPKIGETCAFVAVMAQCWVSFVGEEFTQSCMDHVRQSFPKRGRLGQQRCLSRVILANKSSVFVLFIVIFGDKLCNLCWFCVGSKNPECGQAPLYTHIHFQDRKIPKVQPGALSPLESKSYWPDPPACSLF
jgi:hypothetical protein